MIICKVLPFDDSLVACALFSVQCSLQTDTHSNVYWTRHFSLFAVIFVVVFIVGDLLKFGIRYGMFVIFRACTLHSVLCTYCTLFPIFVFYSSSIPSARRVHNFQAIERIYITCQNLKRFRSVRWMCSQCITLCTLQSLTYSVRRYCCSSFINNKIIICYASNVSLAYKKLL